MPPKSTRARAGWSALSGKGVMSLVKTGQRVLVCFGPRMAPCQRTDSQSPPTSRSAASRTSILSQLKDGSLCLAHSFRTWPRLGLTQLPSSLSFAITSEATDLRSRAFPASPHGLACHAARFRNRSASWKNAAGLNGQGVSEPRPNTRHRTPGRVRTICAGGAHAMRPSNINLVTP